VRPEIDRSPGAFERRKAAECTRQRICGARLRGGEPSKNAHAGGRANQVADAHGLGELRGFCGPSVRNAVLQDSFASGLDGESGTSAQFAGASLISGWVRGGAAASMTRRHLG